MLSGLFIATDHDHDHGHRGAKDAVEKRYDLSACTHILVRASIPGIATGLAGAAP